MDGEMQKRVITVLASVVAYLLASRLADRLVENHPRLAASRTISRKDSSARRPRWFSPS
jgi:hypothetical protein